jgi:acyl transferase domain-containing protein/NAD(P)H-dependent flavin oxidoreductase YrpB (nitropropane dioxygenase family)/NAD(P)-dependent dehydrogenase (short-subunit alcohol dehydrogenase family)/acyl carrier protein
MRDLTPAPWGLRIETSAMEPFDVLVLTPAGVVDVALAIAASRCGALGLLDLEHEDDPSVARASLERLNHFVKTGFGVKIGSGSRLLPSTLLEPASGCRTLLIAGGESTELEKWLEPCRRQGVRVLAEAVSLSEARRAEKLGVDGLVLKGNESGGRVGEDTTFILLQRWRAAVAEGAVRDLPVYAQGGIGLNTAAACAVAGAAGVVLDAQLLLTRESPLPAAVRERLASFDGSETICVGEELGESYRLFARPGLAAPEELRQQAEAIAKSNRTPAERLRSWREVVRRLVKQGPEKGLWLVGQDGAFARGLADRFCTVGGIVQALRQRVAHHLRTAGRLESLAEGSPLARRHGTRFPIVQGPMTRVSDTAAFAESVAAAGALPFLALALLRRAETEKLLRETSERLAGRPWGAGILGFAPPEVRRGQLEAIRAIRPPFALIAGGRPDQACELEKDGIPTYLHVPSPGLLALFLRDGSRRFVFEGRECGGHVGPRSSFVLWESMCETLLEHLGSTATPAVRGEDVQVLFAGGVHDALSAAMVAALSASLAERGVQVGVLIGTAYLFTEEAVASGAIVPRYQQEALRCHDTVLLETGPGHAIRCIDTPYAEVFEQEKRRLQSEGGNPNEIREALEALNIGRLRVAAKGIDRPADPLSPNPAPPVADERRFVVVPEEDQYRRGMYMIGQAAGLRSRVVHMAQLHEDICVRSTRLLQGVLPQEPVTPRERPCDVAIIGMACLLPGANGLQTYWENVLGKVNAITEVPPDHWDWRLYYDANPRARDKISSKWGGFLADVPFDPLVYGMPPNSLTSIEPVQLLLLETVRKALADAGYSERPFDRERTAVVLGAGGGSAQLSMSFGFRTYLPLLDNVPGLPVSGTEILKQAEKFLPEWTEDSFPGILVNVAAGRVSNRFNFGGPNFAVDAACGSSLAALYAGVRELETGTSDLAVVMGADTVQNPVTYMAFSKTHAFSPRGRCSTFDEAADGIVISEGVAVVILKRLADAERDGDRIYAVIKGIGASSDGKDKGLTAPRPEGQLRALRRAYAKANISPHRVGFVEAHGTGTAVGDQTEVASLGQIFREAGVAPQSCAIGSVKSMIGHTKCAAGLAGLINATLALHHKTLPPLLVEKPNTKADFEHSPFFLNTEARPWIHGGTEPRCAGVSAFGFGGTNFHAVLEEYTGAYLPDHNTAQVRWPAELFVWRRASRDALLQAVQDARDSLDKVTAGVKDPAELAFSLWKACPSDAALPTLAIVAGSMAELKEKLGQALKLLREDQETHQDPRGIYFAARPADRAGKVAFLFPGQGSQYPNMLAQLAVVSPEVRQAFDDAERTLTGCLEQPLGKFIFPPSAFTPEQEKKAQQALTQTDVAQPAIGAASLGMLRLLTKLGIEPDMLAGHSYGDYAALCAAGSLSPRDLIALSHQRGRAIREAAGDMPGSMAAIEADLVTVEALLEDLEGVTPANLNSPRQTVIAGTAKGIEAALQRFQEKGIRGQRIPVACAFHSPLVAAAQVPFARALAACSFAAPTRPVYANTTASPYPDDATALVDLLARHLVSPVRFQAEIEAMYAAGARTFIEVGPQGVLTGLVGQTLAGKPHLAVASDLKGRPGLVQLLHLLGQLLAAGIPVQMDRLFNDRLPQTTEGTKREEAREPGRLSPSTWLVNSTRVRPLNGPEPRILGQARPPESPPRPAAESVQPTSAPRPVNGTRVPPELSKPDSTPKSPSTMNPTHTVPQPPPAPALNGSHHPPANPVAGDEATQVMLRFQDLMNRFLDTQRSVMLSYLQGGGMPPPQPALQPPAGLNGQYLPHKGTNGTLSKASNGAVAPPVPPPPNGYPAPAGATVPPPPVVQEAVPGPPPAPPASAPSQVVQPASGPIVVDQAALEARLLEIVCQRTGYPPEMLGLDLDLEADLGIDSIKRVEILGLLADSAGGGSGSSFEMETLTGIKSLRGILEALVKTSGSKAPPAEVVAPAERGGIQRLVVGVKEIAVMEGQIERPFVGAVLLTDDGRGIAHTLAERLRSRGQKVALLSMGAANVNGTATTFEADLTDPRAVEEVLKTLRQHLGPITGLVHLLPLGESPADEDWKERMNREVKSLFLLARGLADDVRRAGEAAFLLAATGMGGTFGISAGQEPLPAYFSPGQGGVAGLVKSLAHEWPDVLVRVIDMDPRRTADEVADRLLTELADSDGPVEVGYTGDRRITLQCQPAPLTIEASAPPLLQADSTVLLTGGARGITAAVALELARRYHPNLVLVGRSALPEEREAAETARLTTPAEIKPALIARFRREGRPAAPAAIEAAYHRLLQDREIRTNLARLREVGARVHYYQADVRDEQAFTAVLAEVYRRFGDIDGVIHGAGVIQDKLIRDKTPESYDRVFGTKVDSALILGRHLRLDRLKFGVFFASVAGRFGNRGQSDYAAANEVLSKLALYLDRRCPGRFVSVVWGPWAGIGMVSELEQHLGQRGLQMIPADVGPLFLDEELRYGRKGESEVVIAGDVGQLARPGRSGQKEVVAP